MRGGVYQPDGYTMLSRPWTAEQQAAHEAYLMSFEPATLAALDDIADPRGQPAFEQGRVTPRSIALAALGFPEPEDRSTATLSPVGDHECVQDLLRPGRIHVLAAEEGSGKTYLAKEIGIRVAIAGGDVAGTFPVLLRGTVLDLSEMHPDDDFEYEQTVLDSLGVSRQALEGRYFRLGLMTAAHGRPALTDPDWRASASAWLRRHGARLLIVDTATGATLIDPWGPAIQRLYHDLRAMLAEVPELCIVLVVHFSKPKGRGGRRISDVLGEWGRWCDILVLLERDKDRTKLSTHKRVRQQRRILATRAGGLLVEPVEVTDAGAGPKVPPDRVLAAIRATPGMTYAELGAAISVSKDTASRYVAGLGDQVRVEPGSAASGPGAAVRVHLVTPADGAIAASPHIAASEAAATTPVSADGRVAASPHPPDKGGAVRAATPSDTEHDLRAAAETGFAELGGAWMPQAQSELTA